MPITAGGLSCALKTGAQATRIGLKGTRGAPTVQSPVASMAHSLDPRHTALPPCHEPQSSKSAGSLMARISCLMCKAPCRQRECCLLAGACGGCGAAQLPPLNTDRAGAACLQGPAVVAEKLSYFIQTGQMVSYLQQAGYKIGTVQLAKFSPLPGIPPHAPVPPLGPGDGQDAVGSAQAGKQRQTPACTALTLPAQVWAVGAGLGKGWVGSGRLQSCLGRRSEVLALRTSPCRHT